MTPVKNQQACGSCWAFSATGSLEAMLSLNGQKLVSLSEQELVDCSYAYGNYGCRGGIMSNAFDYIRDYGISLSKDYSYKGYDDQCSRKAGT